MGRPRVDAEWVALARQRTDSTTEHFGVSMRRRAGVYTEKVFYLRPK